MALCTNCGKEFGASGLRKLFGPQTVCPDCKAEKDKKIRRYLDAVKYFGKDKYLSKEEERSLQELKTNLGLTDEEIEEANKELAKLRLSTAKTDLALCDQKINEICSRGWINQIEEVELEEMLRSLGISEANLPEKTRQNLLDVRMLTILAQGILPTIQVNILLKGGEVCHFAIPAQLLEELSKTRYVGSSSGVSFRVAKGVTFRTGSFRGTPIRESYQKVTDTGILYVTNKKVIFVGQKKNATYPLNKIVDITKYTDGIRFQKENESKARVFLIDRSAHIDAIGMIVSALIQTQCV